MKFIEISDGQAVAINQIEAIKSIDGFKSAIHTHLNIYEANFPYEVLIDILEREEEIEKPLDKKLDAFLSQAGHFAG